MTIEAFRSELAARGGEADIWVVYLEDAFRTMMGDGFQLAPHAAFWTRGAAYARSYERNQSNRWRHCYVFRLHADSAWADGDEPRALAFETVFTKANDLRHLAVTPAEVAGMMGE